MQLRLNFVKHYQDSQQAIAKKIIEARKLLPEVQIDYDFRVKISQICSELDVDGLRGDLVTNRASKALAAFEGHTDCNTRRYLSNYSIMFTS